MRGGGHVYQERLKTFPVSVGVPSRHVAGYVEANAFCAGLAERAEAWPWGQRNDGRRRAAAAAAAVRAAAGLDRAAE